MKTNQQVTPCSLCGNPIPANGGIMTDTGPQHLICRSNQRASVRSTDTGDGHALITSEDGPCEDAPACGCCGKVSTATMTFEEDGEDGMAILFGAHAVGRALKDNAPIDLDQLSDDDLYEHEFAKIIVPPEIDLDGKLSAAEDALEDRFKVRARTKGSLTLAICCEYNRLVVRLFSVG